MPTARTLRFFVGLFIALCSIGGLAQSLDSRWRLRMTDLKNQVKVDATIRFTGKAAVESCMGGEWKRVVVEAAKVRDEKFFPLAERLAYEFERGFLLLGRTSVCDGYLFLSGKPGGAVIRGTYDAAGLGPGKALGRFSLTKVK